MCLNSDTLNLGLAAAGVGSSLLGGSMSADAAQKQREQQLQQNVAAESARNETLQKFLAGQRGYEQQNRGTVAGAVANDSPGSIVAQAAPLGGPAQTVVQNDYNARSADAVAKAKADADAAAALGAYGDTNTTMGLNAQDAGRKVDTVNSFARGDASLLPSQQQLAEFQSRIANPVQPASTFGSAVSGLGNVFATLAGSGKVKLPTSWGIG